MQLALVFSSYLIVLLLYKNQRESAAQMLVELFSYF